MTLMPNMQRYRERLAQLMEERRLELDMTWTAVAAAGGVSTEALRTARYGEGNIAPLTKRAIEKALRWQQGSVDRALAGGEPEGLPESAVDDYFSLAMLRQGVGISDVTQHRIEDALPALIEELSPRQREALTVIVTAMVPESVVRHLFPQPERVDLATWAADHQIETAEGERRADEAAGLGEEPQVEP